MASPPGTTFQGLLVPAGLQTCKNLVELHLTSSKLLFLLTLRLAKTDSQRQTESPDQHLCNVLCHILRTCVADPNFSVACSFLKEHVLIPCRSLLNDADADVRQHAALFLPMLEGRLRLVCLLSIRAVTPEHAVLLSIASLMRLQLVMSQCLKVHMELPESWQCVALKQCISAYGLSHSRNTKQYVDSPELTA